jgi:membrane fusion protein, macrolide-specific efflux system
MNALLTRRPRRGRDARRAGVALLVGILALLTAAAASGCGGSSTAGTPAAGATPTSIQVMATATRGDLAQYVMASGKVTRAGAEPTVEATVDTQSAASVAEGQKATVYFMRGGGNFPQPGQSGMPQAGQSGMPQPQGSGMPQGAPSGMPSPGASGVPFQQGAGAQGGFPGGDRGGTAGTVTAVTSGAEGAATATITLEKLPSGAKLGSTMLARIEVKIIASDVVLVPTAAIKGSGSSATVEVSAGGKTETRAITVGQRSGTMSEVVSGLDEGENVVYTQSFRGFPGGGQSGMPFPQGGQSGMPVPQQGGQSQSGGTY